LREFVAEHRMKVRELGTLLGVSESAASMILKGDRALTLEHVRKLAKRPRSVQPFLLGELHK
jgi:antitoxin component HigA of HigAB toxin-antitoxin module